MVFFFAELNCLNEEADLTQLGHILAKLPIDPRIGKMLVLATIFSVADPVAVIAAQTSNLSEVFNLGKFNMCFFYDCKFHIP